MSDAAVPESSPSYADMPASTVAPAEAGRRDGFWEWLVRRKALRKARAHVRDAYPRVRELIRRAQSAAELGDRVFDAVEPLWTGTAKHLAADLYRQSIFWSVSAIREGHTSAESGTDTWDALKSIGGMKLPWEAEHRDELESIIRDGDFRSLAELSEADRQRVAANLRTLAHSALDVSEPAHRAIRRLLFQRFVRVVGLLLVSSFLLTLIVFGVQQLTHKPNLALAAKWRASSVWGECKPDIGRCGGLKTDIFFHTLEDASPWVEFDLGTPTSISEVYVKNRSDSVPDRAVPLVIEVSDDAQNWRAVARREETFRTWTASFPPLTTRYVRLRVDRRSYFHLDAVEIYP